MLLSRSEMTHDFRGARFDPQRDRELLGFVFSQFLYGEVTGVQVGHWLYQAPTLDAATFLARQAVEEMGHVKAFLEIFRLLGAEPSPPHPVVRFLATDFMGGTFDEHTCLEMALGEGFVLMVLYALIDTIADDGIVRVLAAAAPQEERHVAFGETETARAAAENPRLRDHLLGLSLVSLRSVEKMAPRVRQLAPQHPVVGQMTEFLRATVRASELRLQRMGLLEGPLDGISPLRARSLMTFAVLRRYGRMWNRPKRLTSNYLSDPSVRRLSGGAAS